MNQIYNSLEEMFECLFPNVTLIEESHGEGDQSCGNMISANDTQLYSTNPINHKRRITDDSPPADTNYLQEKRHKTEGSVDALDSEDDHDQDSIAWEDAGDSDDYKAVFSSKVVSSPSDSINATVQSAALANTSYSIVRAILCYHHPLSDCDLMNILQDICIRTSADAVQSTDNDILLQNIRETRDQLTRHVLPRLRRWLTGLEHSQPQGHGKWSGSEPITHVHSNVTISINNYEEIDEGSMAAIAKVKLLLAATESILCGRCKTLFGDEAL